MAESRIQLILTLLDQAYEQPTWHGSNLCNSLRGLTPAQALWRPAEGRHCIWEYALHCAYWKFMARRHLEGDLRRGNFPRKPANFPAVPQKPTARTWKEDLAFLHGVHMELRQAVSALKPQDLKRKSGRWTLAEHAFGAANHDIYHAGQIRLLRRMQEATGLEDT
jgi:hypothetical protein